MGARCACKVETPSPIPIRRPLTEQLEPVIEGGGGVRRAQTLPSSQGGTVMPMDVHVTVRRLMPSRVLARMATTGIYLVHGVPRDLQRAARVRAVREGTTLRRVLLQGLREYAAGTWTPKPDDP